MKGTAMKWAFRTARVLLLAAPLGFGLWGLSQNPFAQPMIERSTEEAARALEAAFHRQFTPDWLESELRLALAKPDPARVIWLADLAGSEGLALPEELTLEIAQIREAEGSILAQAGDCLACAWDPARCQALAELALCAVPVELSPLGDLNALRRQGFNYATGAEVDKLEVGLSLVGLAATGAILVTAGGSTVVKAGTGTLRLAKRMGSLPPGLLRTLSDSADLPVNWSAVMRAAPIEEITDAAKLQRLGALTGDLGRIAKNTSTAEALVLMKHIDGAEDAARMAKVSDLAGAKTLSRVEVLGKARAFRALVRVSDLAITTALALWGAALHVLMMMASGLGRMIWRRR